jgi:hypothetical protein
MLTFSFVHKTESCVADADARLEGDKTSLSVVPDLLPLSLIVPVVDGRL